MEPSNQVDTRVRSEADKGGDLPSDSHTGDRGGVPTVVPTVPSADEEMQRSFDASEARSALDSFGESVEAYGTRVPDAHEMADPAEVARVRRDAAERRSWSPAVANGLSGAYGLVHGYRIPPRGERIL